MVSVSIYTKYCIISVLSYIFRRLRLTHVPCCRFIVYLQQLAGNMFWWPERNVDGSSESCFFNGRRRAEYHQHIIRISTIFVEEIQIFCVQFPSLKSYVDKQNVHRFFDLFYNTVYLYVKSQFIAEMTLSSAPTPQIHA